MRRTLKLGLVATAARRRGGRDASLGALAALRRTTYGLLGSLFVYPARSELALLEDEAAGLLRRSQPARDLPFQPSLRVLVHRLADLGDGELELLKEEYVRLFVVSASEPPCPPYESAYVEQRGRQRGLVSLAVQRAYAAAGIAVTEQGELPDHAALELGFLSLLCGEEERSWREEEAEGALEWLRRQEEFHERHLGRWFPVFVRRLRSATAPDSLYRALAAAAHAFVVHDRDLVWALVQDRSHAIARLGGSPP